MNKKGLKTTILLLLLFCLSLSFLASQPTIEIPSAQNLVILATTDLHGNVWGFSYENDKDTTNTGMARIATYVQQVLSEEEDLSLLDFFKEELSKMSEVLEVETFVVYQSENYRIPYVL